MRKLAAAALAIPVLGPVYLRVLMARRRGVGIAASLLVAATVVAGSVISTPPPTTATIPAPRFDALAPLEFATEIRTSESPSAPVTIAFPVRMSPSSVAASLSVDPRTDVRLTWDETFTMLTVRPKTAWAPATYHTISVSAGALDATGSPTSRATRAAFLTREPTTAALSASDTFRGEALSNSSVIVTFDRPIRDATLALQVSPAGIAFERVDNGGTPTTSYRFAPSATLEPDTTYTVSLAPGTLDADGAPIAPASLELRTAGVPAVVRFRPRSKETGVSTTAKLSVRFTEPMDHATTEAAWSASAGTKKLAGTFRWAENDTVLVFTPSAKLGYGTNISIGVGGGAMSQAGMALASASSITFRTAAKPTPRLVSSGGGGGVGGGSWAAVETYYLGLLNCTRQGGWVTSTGACSSPGGSGLNALTLSKGISDYVARPYAKLLAVKGLCTHTADGDPGTRLRRAGYTSAYWGENIGCRAGDPFASVLASHLYFQSESSYNGGHWRNIMRADFTHVGIGVWVYSGRVRLVCDFYWPH